MKSRANAFRFEWRGAAAENLRFEFPMDAGDSLATRVNRGEARVPVPPDRNTDADRSVKNSSGRRESARGMAEHNGGLRRPRSRATRTSCSTPNDRHSERHPTSFSSSQAFRNFAPSSMLFESRNHCNFCWPSTASRTFPFCLRLENRAAECMNVNSALSFPSPPPPRAS